MSKYKTFRNLFTRIIPNKKNKIKEEIIKEEIDYIKKVEEDDAWDTWEKFNRKNRKL